MLANFATMSKLNSLRKCVGNSSPSTRKVPLQACMHTTPKDTSKRGSQWPEQWPERLKKPLFWLSSSQMGVYGKAAPEDLNVDYERWKHVVKKSYLNGLGINWPYVQNVMDKKTVYGGFAAALRELNVRVMNVVPKDSPDTLAKIYERGLFGIYHALVCIFQYLPDIIRPSSRRPSFLHTQTKVQSKGGCCRSGSDFETGREIDSPGRCPKQTRSGSNGERDEMKWEVRMTCSKEKEVLLSVHKSIWGPKDVETLNYALAA